MYRHSQTGFTHELAILSSAINAIDTDACIRTQAPLLWVNLDEESFSNEDTARHFDVGIGILDMLRN
jgi:hypothetical protein